jgi:GTP-binding protein LepA
MTPRCHLSRKIPGSRIGFRCGFLGLLHLEVIENVWRGNWSGFNYHRAAVAYRVTFTDSRQKVMSNPQDLMTLPKFPGLRNRFECDIVCPQVFMGQYYAAGSERRGIYVNTNISIPAE